MVSLWRLVSRLWKLEGAGKMNKQIFAILEPDNPLMIQALEALKRYHEAQAAGRSQAEIERLRVEAKHLFQIVSEFQQRILRRRHDTLH